VGHEGGRANQRSRTRRDLLEAALEVSKVGKSPTVDAIAERARVSRATAYRYFPNVEDLLAEASLHVAFPDAALLDGRSNDPVERLLIIDDAVEKMIEANETALRMMIASAAKLPMQSDAPARQNRRLPLIEAALAPLKSDLSPADFRKLAQSLSLVIGTEAMLVFKDVLQLSAKQARDVRRWTIRALVDGARKSAQ
jgi:AcrR family transcriptional regulator